MRRRLWTNVNLVKPASGGKLAVTVLVHAHDAEHLRHGHSVALLINAPETDAPAEAVVREHPHYQPHQH